MVSFIFIFLVAHSLISVQFGFSYRSEYENIFV